jgi:hypothetical protein
MRQEQNPNKRPCCAVKYRDHTKIQYLRRTRSLSSDGHGATLGPSKTDRCEPTGQLKGVISMGKLGDQTARESYRVDSSDVDDLLSDFKSIAEKHGIGIQHVIEAKKVLELERQNKIAIQAGDFHDEQMGGFGEKLSELAAAMSEIAGAMREKNG